MNACLMKVTGFHATIMKYVQSYQHKKTPKPKHMKKDYSSIELIKIMKIT